MIPSEYLKNIFMSFLSILLQLLCLVNEAVSTLSMGSASEPHTGERQMAVCVCVMTVLTCPAQWLCPALLHILADTYSFFFWEGGDGFGFLKRCLFVFNYVSEWVCAHEHMWPQKPLELSYR